MSSPAQSYTPIYSVLPVLPPIKLSGNFDSTDPAADDKIKVEKNQTSFVEVCTEVTIKEDNSPQEQLSLQMALCFYMFWFDRTTTENILVYLAQAYNKLPIILRHTSDTNQNAQKYIAVSYVENISIKLPVPEESQQDSQSFLTPFSMKKTIQVHVKHVKFELVEENGILILKSPISGTKVRDLKHLPYGEIFGSQEFYKNYPKLRDELRQKFGCFC